MVADLHARMIDLLAQAKARAVGYLVFFAEPENDKINRTLVKIMDSAAQAEGQPPSSTFTLLKDAQDEFNTDRKLAEAMQRAGNVVLPVLFALESPRGRPTSRCPSSSRRTPIGAMGADAAADSALGASPIGLGTPRRARPPERGARRGRRRRSEAAGAPAL